MRVGVRVRPAFASMLIGILCGATSAHAVEAPENYRLGSGDAIRVVVFQSPDLTLETRVAEDGVITYPLVGTIKLGGLDLDAAAAWISKALEGGGFLRKPQVTIQLLQIRGSKISVLGQVNRPGSFALETFNMRVSQVLAEAGGLAPTGDDRLILTGQRDGKPFRREIDIDSLYRSNQAELDVTLAGGDTVYVPRAPTFYIYGEVTRPGNYRIERNMTMRQALAAGGGLTARGTERRLKVVRKDEAGAEQKVSVSLEDRVTPNDVIYVTESIF